MALARYSLCASNCLPRERSSVSPLSARRKNSQQGAPVSVQLEKEMSSLEMDREVIRCKTCGLVQYRPAHSPVARIARHDPEPVAVALEGFALLFVAHRKRTDDAEPWHVGEDLRGAERWLEPVLHPGIRRGSAAGRSVHPGIATVPAATGLGTMAVHSQEAAGDQRPRSWSASHSPPYR